MKELTHCAKQGAGTFTSQNGSGNDTLSAHLQRPTLDFLCSPLCPQDNRGLCQTHCASEERVLIPPPTSTGVTGLKPQALKPH